MLQIMNYKCLTILLLFNIPTLNAQTLNAIQSPLLDSISIDRIGVANLHDLDGFGYCVDIYGDFIFIGAPYDDEKAKDAGAVYFFVKNDTSWSLVQKLYSNDADSNDNFGFTLSADMDYLIIGAPGDDEKGENSGAAYSFKLIDSNYIQLQKISTDDLSEGDNFGISVSLDERTFGTNYFIAGAPKKVINGVQSGAAYIFSRDSDNLFWTQNKKLAPFDTLHLTQAEFGYSVSIWGQSVLIGAPGDDSLETDAGAIYYLWMNLGEWLAKEKGISFSSFSGNRFGHCVKLTFEHAMVGEPGSDLNSGAAYLFKNTIVYGLYFLKKITPNDRAQNDKFGFSLDIFDRIWGTVSVIASPWKRNNDSSQGAVYYFNSDYLGYTTQPFKVVPKDGFINELFGYDIAVAEDRVAVGAPFKFEEGIRGGTGYVLQTWHYEIPVELTTFKSYILGNDMQLEWSTATETNNRGFEIERKTENSDWQIIGFKEGNGTTTEYQHYSFIDNLFEVSATKLSYRLKQIDYDGTFTYSNIIEIELLPGKFSLSQNYPNPFNPVTKIQYTVPQDVKGETSNVILKVYDVLGNEVVTLVDEYKPAGNYEVDFHNLETRHGVSLPSGVYFYQLRAGDFVETKKMILLR